MRTEKVVFVPSDFQDIYEDRTVKIPTGRTKKNLFGFTVDEKTKEKQTVAVGKSDCLIDGRKLSEDIQEAIDEASKNGFSVISITPIASGNWAYETGRISGGGGSIGPHGGSVSSVNGSLGYSYGYSFTSGVLITFGKT